MFFSLSHCWVFQKVFKSAEETVSGLQLVFKVLLARPRRLKRLFTAPSWRAKIWTVVWRSQEKQTSRCQWHHPLLLWQDFSLDHFRTRSKPSHLHHRWKRRKAWMFQALFPLQSDEGRMASSSLLSLWWKSTDPLQFWEDFNKWESWSIDCI